MKKLIFSTIFAAALSCLTINALAPIDRPTLPPKPVDPPENTQQKPDDNGGKGGNGGKDDTKPRPTPRPNPSPNPDPRPLPTPQPAPQPTPEPEPEPVLEVSAATGYTNGIAWVDLGLPSGLKWATCNIGASSPEIRGYMFAWGETAPKDEYTDENCQTFDVEINNISGLSNFDAATYNCGSSWRLPSLDEIDELINYTKCTPFTHNGISGHLLTSKKNGKSIFIPDSGTIYYGKTAYKTRAFFWGATSLEESTQNAYGFCIQDDEASTFWSARSSGRPVRPVTR